MQQPLSLFINPIALITALIGVISASSAIAPFFGPGFVAFARQRFMGFMGILPKRKTTWGTVYDVQTKRPVPFAKVQLVDVRHRVLETRIADRNGRYGFLASPASLTGQNEGMFILVSHQGYSFPSKTAPSLDTFVYNNLYHGEVITLHDQTLINMDIPLDPIRLADIGPARSTPSVAAGIWVALMADISFWLGVALVPLNFILMPNPFTFGTLCLFLGVASLRLFGISEHPYGVVLDATTKKPISYALLTLTDKEGKRVAFAVSDERGRYFMVTDKGRYTLAVATPGAVTPSRQSQFSIDAKKGWITRQIAI